MSLSIAVSLKHQALPPMMSRAVVDTGTSLLASPVDLADELYLRLTEALQDPEPNPDCPGMQLLASQRMAGQPRFGSVILDSDHMSCHLFASTRIQHCNISPMMEVAGDLRLQSVMRDAATQKMTMAATSPATATGTRR